MALTQDQINEAKSQLRQQIQHLPEEKRKEAEKQIESLSPEALGAMIEQQKSRQQIYRLIVAGQAQAVQIGENEEAIAVLDIMPISEGHALIIPKAPITDIKSLPKKAFDLAEEISKKIILNLKAKSTEVTPEIKFGEAIINIIPIYDKPLSLDSPRDQKTLPYLDDVGKKINTEVIKKAEKKEVIKIDKKKTEENQISKLKRRIP